MCLTKLAGNHGKARTPPLVVCDTVDDNDKTAILFTIHVSGGLVTVFSSVTNDGLCVAKFIFTNQAITHPAYGPLAPNKILFRYQWLAATINYHLLVLFDSYHTVSYKSYLGLKCLG